MPPPPPPPPPPPAPSSLPSRTPQGSAAGRGALLSDIHKGKALKKTVTKDRSAPQIGKVSGGSGPSPLGGAPPVPGLPKAPGNLAPPVPGSRVRSNSDQGSRDAPAVVVEAAPQLGGLFAGGMPKLRKTGGGVDTGANRDASYLSDPELPPSSAPKPPVAAAAPKLRPGAAPAIPRRPAMFGLANHPSIANLRRTGNGEIPRPLSTASTKGPPPPIGKKPPPPPGSRKPSFNTAAPSVPSAPAPPPPSSAAPSLPPAPPPPPPSLAPRLPPASAKSHLPPPPPPPPSAAPAAVSSNFAMQAAIRAAAAAGSSSPTSAPPPPPPFGPPSLRSAATASSPPPPPPNTAPPRAHSGSLGRSMLDPSNFVLAPSSSGKSPSPPRTDFMVSRTNGGGAMRGERILIQDPRWKFVDESMFPKPREFRGGPRRYRAGRGSSVPLDLAALG